MKKKVFRNKWEVMGGADGVYLDLTLGRMVLSS